MRHEAQRFSTASKSSLGVHNANQFHRNQTPGSWIRTPAAHLGDVLGADHLLPVERALILKVTERGPKFSLRSAFNRYQALGTDSTVTENEFRALLRTFNLEASNEEMQSIVHLCRGSSRMQAPCIDINRFMERLSNPAWAHSLGLGVAPSQTPMSGFPTPRRMGEHEDFYRYTKKAPTPHRVRFEDDATGLDVGSEYHTSHATFSQNDSPADSQPASEYGGRNEEAPATPFVETGLLFDRHTASGPTPGPASTASKARSHTISENLRMDEFFRKFDELIQVKLNERCAGNRRALYECFRLFDRKGLGKLNTEDFKLGCHRLNMILSDEEAAALMRRYDTNQDGHLDIAEFSAALMPQSRFQAPQEHNYVPPVTGGETYIHRLTVKEFEHLLQDKLVNRAHGKNAVRKAFRIFDPSGSGVISYSQFKQTLHALNIHPTNDSLRQILRSYDASGDGVIDYTDFVAALTAQETETYKFDEEKLALTDLRPGLQPERYVEHAARENHELTIPRFESMLKAKMEQSGTVIHKGGALALRRLFQFYDRDGVGSITGVQFRETLKKHFQLILTDDFFGELMTKYDPNSDGLIEYVEFSRLVLPECFPDLAELPLDLPAEGTSEYYQVVHRPYGDQTNTPRKPTPHPGGKGAATPDQMRESINAQFMPLGDLERLLREKIMGLSGGTVRELRKAFLRFNPNGGGTMTYEDFDKGLRNFHIQLGRNDFHRLVERYDPDGTGAIDYNAFVTRVVPPAFTTEWRQEPVKPYHVPEYPQELTVGEFEQLLRDRLQHSVGCYGFTEPTARQKALRRLDPNDTGLLSPAEFKQLLASFNFKPGHVLFDRLLQRYSNEQGAIDCNAIISCVLVDHANVRQQSRVVSQIFG